MLEALKSAAKEVGAGQVVLQTLGRTSAWHHVDNAHAFRDEAKSLYRPDVPVHLQDQALCDAVETMRRFIEAGITAGIFGPRSSCATRAKNGTTLSGC